VCVGVDLAKHGSAIHGGNDVGKAGRGQAYHRSALHPEL
jgi:hypothetical protein